MTTPHFEPRSCPHNDTWFDRTLCIAGNMHTICNQCGRIIGQPCPCENTTETLTDATTAAFVFRPLPISALVAAHTNTGNVFPISGDAITTTTKTRTK